MELMVLHAREASDALLPLFSTASSPRAEAPTALSSSPREEQTLIPALDMMPYPWSRCNFLVPMHCTQR